MEIGVAALIEQEAVVKVGSIVVLSHDLAGGVDPKGNCGCFARARHVEYGETVTRLGHCLPAYAHKQTQGHQTAQITLHSRTLSLEVLIIGPISGINHVDPLSKGSGRASHVRWGLLSTVKAGSLVGTIRDPSSAQTGRRALIDESHFCVPRPELRKRRRFPDRHGSIQTGRGNPFAVGAKRHT